MFDFKKEQIFQLESENRDLKEKSDLQAEKILMLEEDKAKLKEEITRFKAELIDKEKLMDTLTERIWQLENKRQLTQQSRIFS
jgi:hypothetical protein